MKSSKVKKILSIVIISIIVAITLATIILAVIPKKLYNPIHDGYYNVTVYKNKVSNGYPLGPNASDETKAFNDKVSDLIAESVKDNLLSSIFQGTSKFEVKVVSKNEGNVETSIAKQADTICLVFDYLDSQTLKFDDEVYINSAATTSDQTVQYRKVFMPISKSQSFEECTVYLADSSNKSSYQIKFLAHQSAIYDYLQSLTWDAI